MKIKSLALVGALILALLLFTGCNQTPGRITRDPNKPAPPKNATLVIGAAASLNEAFTELGQLFETKNLGWKVEFTFASSGNLKSSIEQGAPLDVFASAAEKQMNDLKSSGHIDANSVKLMLKNELVMVAPKNSTVKSLNEVTALARVAIGEPISVPAGQYAKQSLTSLGYYEELENKLIFAKDVRQVLFYIERNEVDAGFVYATDAAKSDKVQIVSAMPEGSYPTILYPIGIVASTKHRDGGEKWIEFVLSEEGQKVLSKYGFKKP